MIYVGIDPGKTGAVAVILPDRVYFEDMPTLKVGTKNEYDTNEMAEIIWRIRKDVGHCGEPFVMLEKSQAMPPEINGRRQGVASSFQVGLGYGIWLGLLSGLGIAYEVAHPATWKRKMLADMPKGKEASILKAKQLFPQVAASCLKRKKDHGRAEALLLAEYGRRLRKGISC